VSKVGILNFQSSNSQPLFHTIKAIGHQATLIDSPNSIRGQDKLIIPGVGHIGAFTRELEYGGYRESILEHILSEKFVLGICLGMHALTSSSEEDHSVQTLKIFSSQVNSMIPDVVTRTRVPHVGWNSVTYPEGEDLFHSIPQESDFYFTHSFAVSSLNHETIAVTEHGKKFSAAIKHKNVYGVQFHPEKSQKYGTRLLSNFCGL
jgi:imidazole glycerol-phosphate synthase subunit HisH